MTNETIICGDCGGREFTASIPHHYGGPSIELHCIKCGADSHVCVEVEIGVCDPGKVGKA